MHAPEPQPHRRRPRYRGKYPRRFEEKYKEQDPAKHPETQAKVLASGKTPAGSHRPIMVAEILAVLRPAPGEVVVDCTLGYGGHAAELLRRILPGGRLLGLDADPVELPRTEARLRGLGFGEEVFTAIRTNFAGLPRALAGAGLEAADAILADLGVSSMQLDNPARGFTFKAPGPLDLRLNPQRGVSGADWLARTAPDRLLRCLVDFADEPHAALLAPALAGRLFPQTTDLADAIRRALPGLSRDGQAESIRRVFQAVRIAVNDEFSALENLLRNLPQCLKPGGRVAVLTFHSGEDRRVKHAFAEGQRQGVYSAIADTVERPSPEERRENPRSNPAKLRWAVRA